MHQLMSLRLRFNIHEKRAKRRVTPVTHAVSTEIKHGDEGVNVGRRGRQATYAVMDHVGCLLDCQIGERGVMQGAGVGA